MSSSIKHPGKIVSISNQTIHVSILSVSACASCNSQHFCSLSEMKNKQIDIVEPLYHNFTVGNDVMVEIQEKNGLKAVVLAYIFPAFVLFSSVIISICLSFTETIAAIIAIGSTAIYYCILYLYRKKIGKQFTFSICENNS